MSRPRGYRGSRDASEMGPPADIPSAALGPHLTVSDGVADRVVGGVIPPTAFTIPGVVTVYPDGRVDLANDLDLDDAARRFWDAVRRVTGWERPGTGPKVLSTGDMVARPSTDASEIAARAVAERVIEGLAAPVGDRIARQ